MWTEKKLFHSNRLKGPTSVGPVYWHLKIFFCWKCMKDDCIFIILIIWSKPFLINLFSIYILRELLLALQSQIFTLSFQAMFQRKQKNLSSLYRTVLCLGQLFQENTPGLLQRHTYIHTSKHTPTKPCLLGAQNEIRFVC